MKNICKKNILYLHYIKTNIMNFGEKLMVTNVVKRLRNELGMTQAQFAASVHTTQALISSYETGKSRPTMETVTKLAAVAKQNNVKMNFEELLPESMASPVKAETNRDKILRNKLKSIKRAIEDFLDEDF